MFLKIYKQEVFGTFGTINSKLVALDKNKEHFAFVCFESTDSAKECKDKLEGTSLFSQGGN